MWVCGLDTEGAWGPLGRSRLPALGGTAICWLGFTPWGIRRANVGDHPRGRGGLHFFPWASLGVIQVLDKLGFIGDSACHDGDRMSEGQTVTGVSWKALLMAGRLLK